MLTDLDVDISNLDISSMPSDYLVLFQYLKKIIMNLQIQKTKLEEENSLLKEKSSQFFLEKDSLKFSIANLKEKEKLYESMKENFSKKNIECENLKKKHIDEISKYLTDIRIKDCMYEHDIIQTQIQNENMKHKLENFSSITKLNDIYYYKNLDLLKKIDDIRKVEKTELEKIEIKYTNKFDSFKQKVIKFLRMQKLNNEKDLPKKNLNNKLNEIHIQELVNELEIQGIEFLKIIKERDELKQQLATIKNDFKTYKNVALVLSQKNITLKNQFKKIGKKIIFNGNESVAKSVDSKKNSGSDVNEFICNTTTRNYLAKDSLLALINKNKEKTYNSENKNHFFLKSSNISNDSNKKDRTIFKFKLEKDKKITLLFKEKEKYKDLYDFYYEKYNTLTKQYTNIFNAYNEQIEKIYNEEISSKNPNILNLKLETFKQFSFEKMSSEQKYAILIKLINHIAPLVYKKDLENAENILNIKEKYRFQNIKDVNTPRRNNGKQECLVYGVTNKNTIEESSRTANTCGNSGEKYNENISMNVFEDIKKMATSMEKNKIRNKSVIKLNINPTNSMQFYPNHKFID